MDFIGLFTAAGIGSILGSIITTWVAAYFATEKERKERKFNERRNAYVGFIRSLPFRHKKLPTGRPLEQDFFYWKSLCRLVGSEAVRKSVDSFDQLYDEADTGIFPNEWEESSAIEAINKAIQHDFDSIV